jgi:hypothetical protein
MGGGSLVTGALVDETTLIGSTYVAITVGLPDRSTRAQRERGVKGVELDWCVDTACSTNFILPQVAYGLDVEIVGAAPSGVGATGAVSSGQEMLLGTAKLGSDGADGSGTAAITGLSAAIVQVPAPGTAGILGRSFLNCFGAVEFDWRLSQNAGATMCLYQEYAPFDDDGTMDDQTVVPLNELACGLLAGRRRFERRAHARAGGHGRAADHHQPRGGQSRGDRDGRRCERIARSGEETFDRAALKTRSPRFRMPSRAAANRLSGLPAR